MSHTDVCETNALRRKERYIYIYSDMCSDPQNTHRNAHRSHRNAYRYISLFMPKSVFFADIGKGYHTPYSVALKTLLMPEGGAVNRNLVPLTPGGLMHGTRVRSFQIQTPESDPHPDSLRGSSVEIGRIQRRLAWPLRKDDTHKSRK